MWPAAVVPSTAEQKILLSTYQINQETITDLIDDPRLLILAKITLKTKDQLEKEGIDALAKEKHELQEIIKYLLNQTKEPDE